MTHHRLPLSHLVSARPLVAMLLALASGYALAGPQSWIDGDIRSQIDDTLDPVQIHGLDGQLLFDAPDHPVHLAPGRHDVLLAPFVQGRAAAVTTKQFSIVVEPCMHYTFGARRASRKSRDWTLEVDTAAKISGCDPAAEVRAAAEAAPRAPASAPSGPPASAPAS